jgi:hypothetical protein
MKSTIAVLSILAIGFVVISQTIIIHEELLAANQEIRIYQNQALDDKIELKILKAEIERQEKLIAWTRKNIK